MTDLNANALEQDADDGDCSHACRAAQELLNRSWLFVPSVYARLWRAGGSHPGGRGSRRHCGPPRHRLHRVLEPGCMNSMNISLKVRGTKGRRCMDEIDHEIKPPT